MFAWIHRQQEEIARDRALRLYGVCLAAAELLTAWWFWSRDLSLLLARSTEAICWPFFPDCAVTRVLPGWGIALILAVFSGLAIAAGIAFIARPRWAWWLLLASEALKLLIVAQDFRLRANQHYMAFFVVATFLFVPDPRRALRYLVVLFYVWAAVLKLNPEWLSGAALYKPVWFFTGKLLPIACAYVIVLELVVVWGLLSRRAAIFWFAFAQFLIFHVFSWPVVGAFYPLLMASLLAIFPLCRLIPGAMPERAAFQRERLTTWALLGGFSLLQLVPLTFPGDTAITGEGRLFSLHMFDARLECRAQARIHDQRGKTIHEIDLKMALPPRIACDPLVYYDRARTLCRQLTRSKLDLELTLDSRRTTEPNLRPVIALDDFCTRDLTYAMWRPNSWILK